MATQANALTVTTRTAKGKAPHVVPAARARCPLCSTATALTRST